MPDFTGGIASTGTSTREARDASSSRTSVLARPGQTMRPHDDEVAAEFLSGRSDLRVRRPTPTSSVSRLGY